MWYGFKDLQFYDVPQLVFNSSGLFFNFRGFKTPNKTFCLPCFCTFVLFLYVYYLSGFSELIHNINLFLLGETFFSIINNFSVFLNSTGNASYIHYKPRHYREIQSYPQRIKSQRRPHALYLVFKLMFMFKPAAFNFFP